MTTIPEQSSSTPLITAIQKWKECDSKIKHLNIALAELRKTRAQVSEILLHIMEENNVQELKLKDGRLSCVVEHPYKQLSKKDLQDILSKYPAFSPGQADQLVEFISENRVRNTAKQKIVHRQHPPSVSTDTSTITST
jgi:hypothetical protein